MRPQEGASRRLGTGSVGRREGLRALRFAALVAAAATLAGCAGADSPFAALQPHVPDVPKVDPATYPSFSTPEVARKPTLTPDAQAKLQKDLENVSQAQIKSVEQANDKGP